MSDGARSRVDELAKAIAGEAICPEKLDEHARNLKNALAEHGPAIDTYIDARIASLGECLRREVNETVSSVMASYRREMRRNILWQWVAIASGVAYWAVKTFL